VIVESKYRTFWPRFWAGLVDTLVFVPFWAIGYWFWDIQATPAWLNLVVYLVSTFAGLAYSVILHARYGQTLGKRLCGVRVVDISEGPLSWTQAVLRDLPNVIYPLWASVGAVRLILAGLSPLSGAETLSEGERQAEFWMNAWLIVELVTTLTNAKRRSVHDYLARSVVVRVNST
jgi:uncharacterized RDD family membrane protein YckC